MVSAVILTLHALVHHISLVSKKKSHNNKLLALCLKFLDNAHYVNIYGYSEHTKWLSQTERLSRCVYEF